MRRSRVGAAAVALALLALPTGCTGADDPPTRDESVVTETGATDVLATTDWAVLDGMVSVQVRNDGDRTLRRATALLSAVDEHGVTVASSAAQAPSGDCCTVRELRPGETYGLYFDTTVDEATIDEVVVRYRDVSWSASGPAGSTDRSAARVSVVELTGSPDGAVVVADVTPRHRAIDAAIVQAVLDDANGDLLAVVSGRWRCLVADEANRIRMQLFHNVPAGATVSGVTVLPVTPSDGAAEDGSSCPSRPRAAG